MLQVHANAVSEGVYSEQATNCGGNWIKLFKRACRLALLCTTVALQWYSMRGFSAMPSVALSKHL